MIIRNGLVFQEDGKYKIKDIYIENHKIVLSEKEVSDKTVVDATGLKIIPGLLDVHSHGAFGHDFCDASVEGLQIILKYEKEHGITSYCPTSMTLEKDKLKEIFATVLKIEETTEFARVVGINMEGPFIASSKKGAQNGKYIINPNIEMFQECNSCCDNLIKLVTLAPELEGAIEFIEALHDKVSISLGHTTANYEITKAALDKGANHITHLYNAMPPFSHREPGVIGAAADSENCMVELITDGIHIHPSVVRATFKLFKEKVVLISDSMMATGMANGTYELGGQTVIMKDKKATLEDGTIAGSATNLFDCMKKAISFGVPEEEAVFAATKNPAKSIGIYDKIGSITVGKEADLLLVNNKFELIRVI